MLEPVVERYRKRDLRRYFRADAAFAKPEIYEFLEAEGYLYAIRLPTNPTEAETSPAALSPRSSDIRMNSVRVSASIRFAAQA